MFHYVKKQLPLTVHKIIRSLLHNFCSLIKKQYIMRQTVIGLFNKSSDAQQAVQRLLSNGFTNDNVDISLSTTSGATAGTTSGTTGSTNFNLDNEDRDEHESGISRFFKNLFGDDDNNDNDDANRFSKASRGKSLVTVH